VRGIEILRTSPFGHSRKFALKEFSEIRLGQYAKRHKIHREFIGPCSNTKLTSNPPGVAKRERRTAVALRDISNGEWTAIQSNNWEVLFDLNQTPEGKLSGDADAIPQFAGGETMDGGVDPNNSLLQENSVRIRVNWETGSKGEYSGGFNGKGRIVGQTFDVAHPSSQATWVSDETF
jgi:hypothetical protein